MVNLLTGFKDYMILPFKGRELVYPLHELSMGMSGDIQHAIAAGSTMIRVGTALFRDLYDMPK